MTQLGQSDPLSGAPAHHRLLPFGGQPWGGRVLLQRLGSGARGPQGEEREAGEEKLREGQWFGLVTDQIPASSFFWQPPCPWLSRTNLLVNSSFLLVQREWCSVACNWNPHYGWLIK